MSRAVILSMKRVWSEYLDPSVPSHAKYTGWSVKYTSNIAEGHRLVQHGINPVCRFAYAVTNQGARNVLEWAGHGDGAAFDIRVVQACWPRLLNVVSVTPEIMHHYTPPHNEEYWGEVDEADGKGAAVDESDFEHKMGGTENILNSTRCKVLFDSTCMKPFRAQF